MVTKSRNPNKTVWNLEIIIPKADHARLMLREAADRAAKQKDVVMLNYLTQAIADLAEVQLRATDAKHCNWREA